MPHYLFFLWKGLQVNALACNISQSSGDTRYAHGTQMWPTGCPRSARYSTRRVRSLQLSLLAQMQTHLSSVPTGPGNAHHSQARRSVPYHGREPSTLCSDAVTTRACTLSAPLQHAAPAQLQATPPQYPRRRSDVPCPMFLPACPSRSQDTRMAPQPLQHALTPQMNRIDPCPLLPHLHLHSVVTIPLQPHIGPRRKRHISILLPCSLPSPPHHPPPTLQYHTAHHLHQTQP